MKKTQVFISHANGDQRRIELEILPMIPPGIECWYSKYNIATASQWEREIINALRESDWFIAVLTPKSMISRWVKAEVDWWFDEIGGNFIPLILEQCNWKDIHLFARSLQGIDASQNLDVLSAELFKLFPSQTSQKEEAQRWYMVAFIELQKRYAGVGFDDVVTEDVFNSIPVCDHKKALEALDNAVRLNPNYVEAYLTRGDFWECDREFDNAWSDYQNVLRIDPNNATANDALKRLESRTST